MKYLVLIFATLLTQSAYSACGPQQSVSQCTSSRELCRGDQAYFIGLSSGPYLTTILNASGNTVTARIQNQIRTVHEVNFTKAKESGGGVCNRYYCVGDRVVYNGTGGHLATVKGVTQSGNVVILVHEGLHAGKLRSVPSSGHGANVNITCAQ